MFERLESDILDAVWASFDIYPPPENECAQIMAADDRLLAYETTYPLEDEDWAEEAPDRTHRCARTTSGRSKSGLLPESSRW